MTEKIRKPIGKRKKLPQFTIMNVIEGQAGLENYSSLFFYSLTIDNILNIIVLLILAGVALSLTVGDNGLFRRAQNAADTYEQASKKEKIELAIGSTFLDETGDFSITKSKLENALRGELGNDTEISVEENGDGSFLITIDNKNEYYVGEDGELIDS